MCFLNVFLDVFIYNCNYPFIYLFINSFIYLFFNYSRVGPPILQFHRRVPIECKKSQ